MVTTWHYALEFAGRTIPVAAGVSIVGRSRSCDIQIPEPSVSRRHLRMVTVDSALIIEELSASNGTCINGDLIDGRQAVRHGDLIELGDAKVTVSIRPVKEARPAQGFGEATMFLQQQSVDIAQRIESAKDTEPLDAADNGKDSGSTAPKKVAAELESPEAAAMFATMAIDSAELFEKAAAPAASADEGREDLGSPAPLPEPAQLPEDGLLREDTRSAEEPTHEASMFDSTWDGLESFDSLVTPPAVSPPVPPAAPVMPHPVAVGIGPRAAALALDLGWISLFALGIWLGLGYRADPQGWQTAGLIALGFGSLVTVIGWGLLGTTPGKRLLHLYVCTDAGQPGVGLARAVVRAAGWLLSLLTFGIGFLVASRADHRALHDRIAGTYVGRLSLRRRPGSG